ncbi:MAG: HD domain-containing protein [Candidatus Nanoarchaeia archaeon]|nr:HD domain-containing protein [Candidatus Nanoarchaeia archaeon]
MIEKIKDIVKKECGGDSWSYSHMVSVVKYANQLAEKLGADKEIVEISAWLHDITRIKGNPENHHISGPIEAERILRELNYPQDRIDKVKHCINAHRGSQSIKRETLEAECVASADAMDHFDNLPTLLYVAYVKKQMSIEEGRISVRNKLERSWNKLIPEAKEIILPKYEAAKLFLKE